MDLTASEIEVLLKAGRWLSTEEEGLTAGLRHVVGLLEAAWPSLRATVSLGGGAVVVGGSAEVASGDPISTQPLVRGARTLGSVSFALSSEAGSQSLPSPAFQEALALLVAQEVEIRRLASPSLPASAGLVGSSGAMQEVFRLVEEAAGLSVPVLLSGEPGVGKALLAEAVHRRSAVSQGPFVLFSGSALPESMVESGLFGHAKAPGGRFGEARGGTLYLEEVGDLSLAVQTRLLAALDTGARVPRLVASTRRSLETLVAAGRFHAELQARLSGFPIVVPPLRDRGSDIIALADHFVTVFSLQTGKEIKRISTPTLEMLLTYPWPGNVRELETVIERAVLLSDDEVIHGYHLPPSLQSSVHSGTRMHGRLADRLDSLEYEMLVESLKAAHGNITQAARELGLTKRIMGLRMRKYELDYRSFRQGPSDLADEEDWN